MSTVLSEIRRLSQSTQMETSKRQYLQAGRRSKLAAENPITRSSELSQNPFAGTVRR